MYIYYWNYRIDENCEFHVFKKRRKWAILMSQFDRIYGVFLIRTTLFLLYAFMEYSAFNVDSLQPKASIELKCNKPQIFAIEITFMDFIHAWNIVVIKKELFSAVAILFVCYVCVCACLFVCYSGCYTVVSDAMKNTTNHYIVYHMYVFIYDENEANKKLLLPFEQTAFFPSSVCLFIPRTPPTKLTTMTIAIAQTMWINILYSGVRNLYVNTFHDDRMSATHLSHIHKQLFPLWFHPNNYIQKQRKMCLEWRIEW